MRDKIAANLKQYQSAVLTGIDANGYPLSVRCVPEMEAADLRLRVQVSPGVLLQPGPANLLCHRHNEMLWEMYRFLLRGDLEKDDQGWIFSPHHFISGTPGTGVRAFLPTLRWLLGSRRQASRYLQRRQLSRPRIPWGEIQELKAQSRQPEETLPL